MVTKGTYTCIFGGGAVRGFAYIGAIRAMKELGINIKTYAGSSVGSIIAAFLAVGYNDAEIEELFMQVKFDLFRDLHFSLGKDFAISKGNVFTEWVREAIEKKFYGDKYNKGHNSPVKFGDISENLIILTTDLNTFCSVEFSNFETPDFEIAQAVRISCSMPGLMTSVDTENTKLVDGDLLKGIPLWKLSKNINAPDSRVLEFRLEGNCANKLNNPFDFLNSIYSCMTCASTDFIIDVFGENDKYDYVKINTGGLIIVDFNISPEVRKQIIEIGYNDSMNYLTKTFISKKMRISNFYKEMIHHMDKLIHNLKFSNVKDSKDTLKDLFLLMSDAYKYIDTDIFESIWTLKNDIYRAELKKSFFGKPKFKDKNPLLSCAEIINKIIKIKNDELADYIENIG